MGSTTMKVSSATATDRAVFQECEFLLHRNALLRLGVLKLLAIKDSDVRLLTLEQTHTAVDQGLHAGGVFSATLPLVALFCGGFLRLNNVKVGDVGLQEGSRREVAMYAAQNHLDNYCVLVDRNNGQLDIHTRRLFPMPPLDRVFASYGWNVHDAEYIQASLNA
jgi:Transketolase, thiamine diphosphate binding domain